MNLKHQENEIELVVPLLPDIELMATRTVSAIAEYMSFETDKIEDLKLALIEACINAFEHSKAKDNKLYLKFIMQENRLTVIIKDNGLGFDSGYLENSEIVRKKRPENKRGWGLMLIKNLMDEVHIESNSGGTTLIMTKIK